MHLRNPTACKYCFIVGGSIGSVSVDWYIDEQRSSATKMADYVADGATLSFATGDVQQSMHIFNALYVNQNFLSKILFAKKNIIQNYSICSAREHFLSRCVEN